MKFSFLFSNCFCRTNEDVAINRSSSSHGGQTIENFRVFSYNELKAASGGFRSSNKIGEGGFGSVFKGKLQDGSFVAIKVVSVEIESMRGEREFISELSAQPNIRHENLVTLRGCCVDGAKRYLVYDYMENNSLSHAFLGSNSGGEHNRIKFSWTLRRNVSIGVARGLVYLHEEVNPHIVHRDIKASNILLDGNFTPKVSDLGLSKLFRDNTSHISTRVAGTLGYLSPEYAITGHLSRKSDVYSFGVLLLEIVSGKPVVDFDLEHGEQFLVDKAWRMYIANCLLELVDPVLNGDFQEDEALRFLKVGLLCVQEKAKLRPPMPTALQMLTNEIDVENVEVSQPGIVEDLINVKIGQGQSSTSHSFFSKASTSRSPQSPLRLAFKTI